MRMEIAGKKSPLNDDSESVKIKYRESVHPVLCTIICDKDSEVALDRKVKDTGFTTV